MKKFILSALLFSIAPQTPTEEPKVYIEFSLYLSQVQMYPNTAAAFVKAVNLWAEKIPIMPQIYIEDNISAFTPEPRWSTKPRVIQIQIANLSSPEMGSISSRILGMWLQHQNTILLDGDSLEQNNIYATAVALHELGHVFGLQHIVSKQKLSSDIYGGYIVAPQIDPNNAEILYIMNPGLAAITEIPQITELEKKLILEYIFIIFSSKLDNYHNGCGFMKAL